MSVNLLTEYHLEFLSLKGGCTGLTESTLVQPALPLALLLIIGPEVDT